MGDGGAAYNRAMLHSLHDMLAPAVAERLTLVINHVLGGEPVATERLRPHAGRTLALTLAGWPRLLPPPPALAWRVTPAGLLDWCGLHGVDAPDLAVQVDASNPALLLARLRPPTAEALRATLERLFGPVVAQQLHQVGRTLAAGMRTAIRTAAEIAERLRSRRA